MLDLKQIDKVVLNALEEDMPYGDITTDSLIPEDRMVEAKFLAKADGVICGMPVACLLYTSYLGVGAVFHTGTKPDAKDVSFDTLKEICSAVRIPVVAIGGISKDNILRLSGSGICGVAVISAIFAQPDIEAAARELRQLAERCV